MSMVIGTNVASLTAQRHLTSSRAEMETSMERLSSGKRINSAMDDTAGMAIVNRMDARVTGLNQGIRNANDGISMVQTTESALKEVSNILNRMKELAVQASSGTYTASDSASMDNEFSALSAEITRISDSTNFNGRGVLSTNETVSFQVGSSNHASDSLSVGIKDIDSNTVGSVTGDGADHQGTLAVTTAAAEADEEVSTQTIATADVLAGDILSVKVEGTTYTQAFDTDAETTMTALGAKIAAGEGKVGTAETAVDGDDIVLTITAANANEAITQVSVTSSKSLESQSLSSQASSLNAIASVDQAIADVSEHRGTLGAVANRLEYTASNLMTRSENQSASKSRIEDADFAVESANLAKSQVLQQAGTAMLAQANQSSQSVLSLLQ